MNKKCHKCDQPATVHIVDIDIKGHVREAFLCKTHAQECGVFSNKTYDLLSWTKLTPVGTFLSNNVCPYCNCAKEWIEKTNLVGCSKCYSTFKIQLKGFREVPMHFGKVPKRFLENGYKPRIQFLETRMQAFIRTEQYEKAYACRKKIKKFLSKP